MDGFDDDSTRSRKKLLSYIDIEVMREILDAFTETTKLMANIVDVDGRSIFSRNSFNKCCSFCKLIYGMEGGLERCRKAYKRYGKQAVIFGEPYIFRCPSGLVEWAAPIVIEGEHMGTVICGQILMWEPEDFFWIELRELNKDLTSDFTELFAAVKELPVVSPSIVRSASYLILIIANYIMKSGWDNYTYNKEINYQQSLLHKEIENRNQLEREFTEKTMSYSFANERDLLAKVKLGEADASRELLQKLLVDIMVAGAGDVALVRTSVLELCVLISRSAVDTGVNLKQAIEKNTQMFNELGGLMTIEEICLQAQRFLQYYLDCVIALQGQPANNKVHEIKKIIWKSYREDLTLETIAESVYLCPSYASRLFKKVQDCSIMKYLTTVRMEEAKRLLQNPMYLINEVASNVGYSDASYFTKVFCREEGITPTQYRHMQCKRTRTDTKEA